MNLTQAETDNIRIFLENGIMSGAVKKVLLSVTEVSYEELAEQFPDNQVLGAKLRALAEGKVFLEKGFDKLTEFTKNGIINKRKNPAI